MLMLQQASLNKEKATISKVVDFNDCLIKIIQGWLLTKCTKGNIAVISFFSLFFYNKKWKMAKNQKSALCKRIKGLYIFVNQEFSLIATFDLKKGFKSQSNKKKKIFSNPI